MLRIEHDGLYGISRLARMRSALMVGIHWVRASGAQQKVIAHLMETAKAWSNGQEPDDDMTFIVMTVKA